MGAQRRAKGAKREPKGTPAGAIFTYLFVIVSGFVFQLFFGWFWSRFGRYFALFWVVILGIVSDIEKKARPHESAVIAVKSKVGHLGKRRKSYQKSKEKG